MERLAAPHGGEVGYHRYGDDGPWVVLLHGWCGSASHWDEVALLLAARSRIVAVSYPGFGAMAAPSPAGRTIEAMADAVVHVIEHLLIDRPVLVGHSMGGPVATEAAIRLGGRAAGLIGLDTLTDRGYYARQTRDEIARRRAEFDDGFEHRMRAMVDLIAHPSTPDRLRAAIAGDMATTPAGFALDIKDALFE